MADQNENNQTTTWNSGGTTFDFYKVNVTDTASAAASRLMLLQVGGVDKFYVRKDGLTATLGGLLMKQSATPTPTVEGTMEWDSDDHHFAVGVGGTATRKVGKAPTVQIISATGAFVYTPTAGARFAKFEACGGGGGSGGINGTAATTTAVTAGGGSGFSGSTDILDITGAATFSGSIGAAGAAGDLNSNGGNGGNTSITVGATTYTWGGGTGSDFRNASGGFYSMEGGLGGTGTNVTGFSQQGTTGFGSTADNNVTAGAGGCSMFCTGGAARHSFVAAQAGGGLAGAGKGSGASGAFNNGANTDQLGAAGTAGYMRITEYY